MKKNLLSFQSGNAKLSKEIATFSLPCGWTCPFAKACKARVSRTGKFIEKGHEFRCYAAATELMFPTTRKSRWHNFDLLRKAKTVENMALLIHNSLPNKKLVRIHQSGDFYNQTYFDAWIKVALMNPDKVFYAYTKSLPYWTARMTKIPSNFKLIASYGGTRDVLIDSWKLRHCKVVLSEDEAKKEGLPISHDDKDHYEGTHNYALLVHSNQPAGTPAAKAWYKLNKAGKSGYKAKYF